MLEKIFLYLCTWLLLDSCDLTVAVFCAEVLLLTWGGGLLGAGALLCPSASAPLEAADRMASLHREVTSDRDTGG